MHITLALEFGRYTVPPHKITPLLGFVVWTTFMVIIQMPPHEYLEESTVLGPTLISFPMKVSKKQSETCSLSPRKDALLFSTRGGTSTLNNASTN